MRKVMYNIKAVKFTAFIWTGIEVVITALTRNQVVAQAARGFESHPVRQRRKAGKKTRTDISVRVFCVFRQ